MQKERACTLMGSHSRKLGLVLWLISFPDVCVTVLDLIHTRQEVQCLLCFTFNVKLNRRFQ